MATGTLTIGVFYYFLTAVTLFLWPVRMMGRILTDLGKATIALERLNEILDEAEESDLGGPAAPSPPGHIVFENVSFSHADDAPVLH